MKTHYKFKGKFGNKIEIQSSQGMREGCFVVKDFDCQLERHYRIGTVGELSMGEGLVQITSIEQVKKAWEAGNIWF